MQAYLNIANISWVTSVANARLRRWAIHNNRSIPRKPPQKIRLRCKSWMKTEGIAIIATFYLEANPVDLPSWLHTQRSERSAMFWNRNIVTREVESHSLYKLSFRNQLNMNKPGTTTIVPGPTWAGLSSIQPDPKSCFSRGRNGAGLEPTSSVRLWIFEMYLEKTHASWLRLSRTGPSWSEKFNNVKMTRKCKWRSMSN